MTTMQKVVLGWTLFLATLLLWDAAVVWKRIGEIEDTIVKMSTATDLPEETK